MENKRAQGNLAEDVCAHYLQEQGYSIVGRNFVIR